MLAINLEPELERHLAELAKRQGQTIDELARVAFERLLEDLADEAAIREALRDYDPSKNVSLDEVMKRLGLED